MRITHKIAAALAVVLAALLFGAAVILNMAVRPGFEQLEQTMRQRNQARVAATLSAISDDLRARVTDYAYWDDTYDFLADHSAAFTNDLGDPWISTYGIDIVVFADSQGRVIWQRSIDSSGAPISDPVTARRLASLVASRTAGRAARSGVVSMPGFGLASISFAGATRTDGGGEPRGWVIMGKRLSAAALSQQAQMRVDLVSAAAPGSLANRMRAIDAGTPQIWEDHRTIHTLSALRDPFGRVTGAVLMRQPREATMLGARSIDLALFLMGGAVLVAMGALWLMLRTLVIRRLERLEAQFHDGETLPPAAAPHSDEISRLTEACNALVGRLSDAGAHEQAAYFKREADAAANRMKAEFLTNVSHELRRPLDAIIGYTELIGEELQGPAADHTRADLERIADAARRLLTLLSEVLDIARIDAGRLDLRPEGFRVEEMVRALEEAALHEGPVNVEVLDDLGGAHTDLRRLNQCLTNTMLNARLLSAAKPVVLRASRRADVLRFEVQALGVWLTPEQLAHALDPLASTHKPSARLAGSGLALVVTRKLLSMMGGALEVRCSADGATFVLTAAAVMPNPASQVPVQHAAA